MGRAPRKGQVERIGLLRTGADIIQCQFSLIIHLIPFNPACLRIVIQIVIRLIIVMVAVVDRPIIVESLSPRAGRGKSAPIRSVEVPFTYVPAAMPGVRKTAGDRLDVGPELHIIRYDAMTERVQAGEDRCSCEASIN